MNTPTPAQISEFTADELDRLLESLRDLGSRVKAVEVAVLREVDRRQIPLGDGMRTLEDWVIGRMDVDRSTARSLVAVTRADSGELDTMLTDGVSFDRVALLAKSGSTDLRDDLDIIGLRQHLTSRTPTERADEQADFERRYLSIQPSLDESVWRLWGQLPALEGKIVADTLDTVADELPDPPAGHRESRATRRADALFVVCDRQTTAPGSTSPVSPPATVIVDATHAPTRPGAWIASGPKVGPSTLERILCESPIDVIARTAAGEPLAVGNASTAISHKTRRYVLARDGGICTVDGCGSTYRLQPHHLQSGETAATIFTPTSRPCAGITITSSCTDAAFGSTRTARFEDADSTRLTTPDPTRRSEALPRSAAGFGMPQARPDHTQSNVRCTACLQRANEEMAIPLRGGIVLDGLVLPH
ncbi:MAG: DUF222 domain-containing protein, partial [Acidimicrobiia bacterium]|nr:DUF222 domain-containing protein [Acidimicrobiia bacterium]